MNALLQCLANAGDLVAYILRNEHFENEINSDNPLGTGGVVAREFRDVLKSMWSGVQQTALSPWSFKAAVGRSAEQFSGNSQQDSHELAAYLLDALHEDLNRLRGPKPSVEFPELTPKALQEKGEEHAAAECWSLYLKRDRSVVVDLFQGQLRSQIRCLRCAFVSTKFDPFMYLTLPVVDANGIPLHCLGDCLREFARQELLCGTDQWFCRRCGTHVDAMKQLTVWKVPLLLLVHLKRFRHQTGLASTGFRDAGGPLAYAPQKLGHRVDFHVEGIDLRREGVLPECSLQKDAPVFDLFALVDHFGSTSFGHYTAVVRHSALGRWHRFDDENVVAVSPAEVATDKAYLLFFRRRGALLRKQTRRLPEAWPHYINQAWPFIQDEHAASSDEN